LLSATCKSAKYDNITAAKRDITEASKEVYGCFLDNQRFKDIILNIFGGFLSSLAQKSAIKTCRQRYQTTKKLFK
jgi:hypothetical protein